ncbi:MAG: hypothetical protein ACYC3X_23215 [Pirellulaceae bacterium]
MAIFNKDTNQEAARVKGDDFLKSAKETLSILFAEYATKADEFNRVEQYNDGLFAEAWTVCESLIKASYRNGLQAGRFRGSRQAK